MTGNMSIGNLMTPQMKEDIDEQTKGSMQEQIQWAQRRAILEKEESKVKQRLAKTLRKKTTNRRRNKAAKKARRKQR